MGRSARPSVTAGIAVAAALSRQGLPYVWAAEGPDTFDCSSLMMWAWAQAGVTIPRNSAAQAELPEVPLDQLQVGDLVTYYSPVSHVGMYVGDGKVLHASMPGVPIKVVPLAAGRPEPDGSLRQPLTHRFSGRPAWYPPHCGWEPRRSCLCGHPSVKDQRMAGVMRTSRG